MSSKELSRNLRKRQTEAENEFWKKARNRKLFGKKFLRQYPIKFQLNGKKGFYIADFICHEAKLVIEIDGSIHNTQREYDEFRTEIINSIGFKVIRFKNSEVINNFDKVITKLKNLLT